MRKLFNVVTVALVAALLFPAPARALNTATPPVIVRYAYESGSVAAGAAIQTAVLNTAGWDSLQILLDNSAGGGSRTIAVACMGSDGTTVVFQFPTVTASTTTRVQVFISPTVGGPAAPTRTTVWNMPLCAKMRVTVAAAGTDAAQLAVYARAGGFEPPQTKNVRYAWDSLGVAAGAIINSNVVAAATLETVLVGADNSAGGSSRGLNTTCLASDGATVLYDYPAVTVTNATRALVLYSADASALTPATGATLIPVPPCPLMKFSLAAAGAAAGSLQVAAR